MITRKPPVQFQISFIEACKLLSIYVVLLKSFIQFPFNKLAVSLDPTVHHFLPEFIQVLGSVLSSIIIIHLITRKKKIQFFTKFKISHNFRRTVSLLFFIFILISGYYFLYHSTLGKLTDMIPIPEYFLESVSEFALLYSLLFDITIIDPIFEEIIMRGIILEGFLNRYKPSIAILLSSILFGIIHFILPQSINALFVGLLLGFIYYYTQSLTLCIVSHMLINTLAILSMDIPLNWLTALGGLMLFSIGFVAVYKSYNKE